MNYPTDPEGMKRKIDELRAKVDQRTAERDELKRLADAMEKDADARNELWITQHHWPIADSPNLVFLTPNGQQFTLVHELDYSNGPDERDLYVLEGLLTLAMRNVQRAKEAHEREFSPWTETSKRDD